MNTKSIYTQFYQKLILATSLFITTLSFIFYGYTKATIYEELKESLVSDAQLIYKVSKSKDPNKTNFNIITHTGISVDLVTIDNLSEISFETFKDGQDHYVELLYPFDIKSKKFIKIIKNINSSREMLTKIFNNLLFLSLGGLILIILYAFTVSKTLLRPILQINKKLSNMNENYLTQIKKDSLPIEFHPLADSINSLTNRIETYVRFKKELFIGAAHELKTPLAVMKLKNEVTLMKQREPEKYQDTLKLTIKQIDDMNKMIGSILDIGRAEGAQFEKATEIDLVQYMQRKTNDYRMLSAQKKITITFYANVNYYNTLLQVTLLNQIIQNFVQNAIKFTPEEKTIAIRLEKSKDTTSISVIDEGIGIDEKIDLFAPFKRVGNEQGAGLGLFLAKNAADALGAKLSLENRKDGKSGCVAKLMLYNNLVCKIS
ncbi:sensor histidine kinase [Malaciobacter marinus]|uniref:histidine kinase n=1 Tax=Malaciobacter marinus TaxID=505249 RepID=A0A347TI38_9BACT|nr:MULTISPECIES: HAMP domain-containing sensor histidine kinase [Malaciobacter]AXX86266.1 two-component system sensor histidine kinase [Malaciobacter marinus]PHO13587.1 two-component sensor histidine kinase [Malaciobacter marinus]PHO14648.1 two-component sensor histidine kinase [Malaciobacter marinus]RYA24112.1 sensor histidine kinase [Malaciobacter halophilus]